MTTVAIAGLITFVFTTMLTIAGEGAAIILIPTFIALGINIRVAMATALLLNSLAMVFACPRYAKKQLIMYKVALPILIVAAICSPIGAYVSRLLDRTVLLWLFVCFLLFASSMMFFYRPKETKQKEAEKSRAKQISYGIFVGAFAGFMAGLLGVGGGNFILPMLVYLGFNPKKASATTAFIVIFSSFAGFLGHASLGNIQISLLVFAALGSILGALLGSWLMTEKLKPKQVKITIGVVLLGIAIKMIWNLVA
jgi:hypothetical protein